MNIEKQRTLKQNSSIHKYFQELSDEANNAGIPQHVIMSKIFVDWSPQAIKSLAQAISDAKYGKLHTSDLTTKELSDVCEELNRIFSEHGVHCSFPSEELLSLTNYYS